MTSARIVTPGQAMAVTPMTRASTPIRISEVEVDLNIKGIPFPGGRAAGELAGGAGGGEAASGRSGAGRQVGRDDDVAFLDLAGRALGQRVHQPHVARVLVRGDLALDVVAQLLG